MTQAQFWDRIAPKYADQPISDPDAYAYTLERTLSYLSPRDRVLELGCGTGPTALSLAEHVGEVVGTDISPGMVNIANARKADTGAENIRFEAAPVDAALRFEGPFDAVVAMNLFHLVPQMERCFVEVAKRLPTGGVFVQKTPCLSDPSQGALRFLLPPMIGALKLIGKAPTVRFFTEAELESALDRAGFDIVEAGNFPKRSRYLVARKR